LLEDVKKVYGDTRITEISEKILANTDW
jgi:hypothetical protein